MPGTKKAAPQGIGDLLPESMRHPAGRGFEARAAAVRAQSGPFDAGAFFSQLGHGLLEVVGLAPGAGEIADGANAVWYAAEGDWTNAGISVVTAIPILGWLGNAFRWGRRGANALDTASRAVDDVADVAAETGAATRPVAGQPIYRVYGGDSPAGGASWSPVNPGSVADYRSAAGLPSGGASGATNTGQFVIEGTLNDPAAVVLQRSALPLDGTDGGLPEYIIPNWMENASITITRVSGANPEF